ncbi:MAG: hypothetical protein QF415_10900 [Candidatus Undinarchaeales archaeon]|jgi:hypothetical protein|nr:hypothetical protein [Candidatus Undinarchaeales archaeon]MDP7494320.1 hypothetical protein [Candidatus Undinarchaeales archaeon]
MSLIDVLSSIHPADRVLVVFHGDADGCSSASLFSLFLESVGTAYTLYTPENGDPRILPSLVEMARDYDYTVVLDIAHRPRDVYEDLAKVTKVVVIDHHLDNEPFDVPDIVYYNPTITEGRKAPVAYLVYEMINELGEYERFCWICLLGVAGDKEQDRFPELVEETFNRFPNLKGGPSYGDFAMVRFLIGIIACGRAYAGGKGATLAVEVLNDAGKNESPEMVVSGPPGAADLFHYRLSTNRVVRNLVDIHDEKATFVPDKALIYYPIESTLYIQNYLAGIIRARRPEWVCTVVNTELEDDAALIELRTGREGMNLRDLATAAIKGIEGADASGHPEAAHARIPASAMDVFRENLTGALPAVEPPSDLGSDSWRRRPRWPGRPKEAEKADTPEKDGSTDKAGPPEEEKTEPSEAGEDVTPPPAGEEVAAESPVAGPDAPGPE